MDKNSLHKQCVFVDDTGPYPVKTVGDPKSEWDGSDAFFYDLEEFCSEPGNCWKVTLLTPITLDCEDPGPHPVDRETICFKAELDAKDATGDYCEEYGDYMTEEGYCCTGEGVIENFYFLEESEHNLDYYCVDGLGNEGPHDDEKFKVEGTPFEIPIYMKWNLISVPFVLLNDNIEAVFADIDEDIESVWTYDGVADEWYVYRPGQPELSDLEEIEPGWGYWVNAYEDTALLVGGSLFQPAKLPPSRNLVPGWNLIGYYGTSWELYPNQDDQRFACGDAFVEPDRYVFGDKVYCSLNSLIDPQEGYPRWSALWSYLNCGGHDEFWLGLNACGVGPESELDRMYAGRGYWVELDVADLYSPATTCIWNDDFVCRWSGGGIIP